MEGKRDKKSANPIVFIGLEDVGVFREGAANDARDSATVVRSHTAIHTHTYTHTMRQSA